MTMFQGQGSKRAQGGDDELSLIPTWSIILAIIVFAAFQYLFHGVLPHHKHEMLPMRLLMGYVSRDVRRRKMPAGLWMLIVVVLPGGIGAVVYFLLRQPMLFPCPHCSTEITSTVHFCPQCQFQMAPVCGRCFRGVQVTDVYCIQCGHDLAEDQAPARLRAYSD